MTRWCTPCGPLLREERERETHYDECCPNGPVSTKPVEFAGGAPYHICNRQCALPAGTRRKQRLWASVVSGQMQSDLRAGRLRHVQRPGAVHLSREGGRDEARAAVV